MIKNMTDKLPEKKETQIQEEIVAELRRRWPDLMVIAILNGAWVKSKAEAVKLIRMGLYKGAADIFIARSNRLGDHGLWLEVKRPSGRLSDEQVQFALDVRTCRYKTAVVHSVVEAFKAVNGYLFGGLK